MRIWHIIQVGSTIPRKNLNFYLFIYLFWVCVGLSGSNGAEIG